MEVLKLSTISSLVFWSSIGSEKQVTCDVSPKPVLVSLLYGDESINGGNSGGRDSFSKELRLTNPEMWVFFPAVIFLKTLHMTHSF